MLFQSLLEDGNEEMEDTEQIEENDEEDENEEAEGNEDEIQEDKDDEGEELDFKGNNSNVACSIGNMIQKKKLKQALKK